jgi:hypothetical protein
LRVLSSYKGDLCLGVMTSDATVLPIGWDQPLTLMGCLQTYYVLDIICWNGAAVSDSDTEFRLFWAASKLQEALTYTRSVIPPVINLTMWRSQWGSRQSIIALGSLHFLSSRHQPALTPIPNLTPDVSPQADPQGIQNSYSSELPFRRDGLLFLNQHATYTPGPALAFSPARVHSHRD